MKHSQENTKNIKTIKEELDKAIDLMDMQQIDSELTKLSEYSPLECDIEDSKLFAMKIINKEKKGNDCMKKNYRKVASFVASGVIIAGIGITTYATGMWNKFDFFDKDKTVTVSSNQSLTKEQAQELVEQKSDEIEAGTPTRQAQQQEETFNSLEDLKAKLGVDVAMPSYIPTDFEREEKIETNTTEFGKDNVSHLVYVTYKSKNAEKRLMGITVEKRDFKEEVTSISQTDAVYKEKYDSKTGNEYTIFDEDGGIIAWTTVNNVDYALVFMGVDEKEIHKVIDSVDLGVYKQ